MESNPNVATFIKELVLELPRWFEPRFVVPLAGMIFASTMNTVSLAAERFEAERGRGCEAEEARRDGQGVPRGGVQPAALDGQGLGTGVRCGQRPVATVGRAADPADHRPDPVAGPFGVGQALEHHGADITIGEPFDASVFLAEADAARQQDNWRVERQAAEVDVQGIGV